MNDHIGDANKMISETPKNPNRKFRSAASGLWYENAAAAGSVDAVELFGEQLHREPNEGGLPFIRRVSAWASKIYSAKEAKL